jgi:DNA (cytosine-5)-methyltransferase 1
VAFAKEIFPPYPEDKFVDKWRKLIPEKPCWTVTAHLAKDSYSHIHYDGTQKRAISVREAARLQSFPDGFIFTGNMGDCYRQIGNAVPPLMAWSIAATLMQLLGISTTLPDFATAPRASVNAMPDALTGSAAPGPILTPPRACDI